MTVTVRTLAGMHTSRRTVTIIVPTAALPDGGAGIATVIVTGARHFVQPATPNP